MILTVIIIQGFIFLGLIFLLKHFMRGHVSGALGHVRSLNEELIRQQEELKKKNVEVQQEYEAKMARLQQEVTAKQAQVKQESAKLLEETRNAAMQEKEKIITEAIATREKMKNEVMAEMEQKSVDYAKDIIERFLSSGFKKTAHDKLVQELIEGIKEVNMENFQVPSGTVEMILANVISEEDKKKLQKLLGEKLKKEIQFKEALDTNLVAGLVIKAGTFVIDGSLRHRLNEASSNLKKEVRRNYQGST